MATRQKTIQFAYDTYISDVANSTVTNLTQTTLYIPETVISFVSVMVDVGFQDIITATGGTISEHRVGLQLASAGYSTITETDPITQSGENLSVVIGPFDYTSYFTTNWSGTSMTCDLQVFFTQSTGTTLGMRNVTAIVTVTYEYDDTSSTHIKTAWIPMESLTGALSTSANSSFGTNQIPQLTGSGGFLPEASVNIRDYFILIEGNEYTSANTDFTISANIDGGTAFNFGTQEAQLITYRYGRWIYKPTLPSTASAHNFQLWATVARCNHITATLVVTYEFDPSSTSTVLNSILQPIELSSPMGSTTTAEASRLERNFFIQEPGTITLQQSSFRINWNCAASPGSLRLRAGGQAYRAYTVNAGVVGGMFSVQQRIDSGSAQGAGVSIARGVNTITIDGYTTNANNQISNVSGVIILNYHSGKATDGVGAHAHTVMRNLLQWDAALTDLTRPNNIAFDIPESMYYFVSIGFVFYQIVQSASQAITFDVECLAGEGKGGGYYDIYSDAYQADNERSASIVWMRGREAFLRYPTDPGADRVDIETARDYRLYTSSNTSSGLTIVYTYHAISYTVSGTISGSAGGTVEIRTYRADNRELVNSTSRNGNGAYSFTWHDNTVELYTEAYEDTTHFGRSTNATAGTSLDVVLSIAVARATA